MKQKNVAGILALLFGVWGTHRFYLGQRFLGFVYITMFFIGLLATIQTGGDAPILMIPAVVGFIDAILFFVMPKEEFDERYNSGRPYRSRRSRRTDFDRPAAYNQPSPQRWKTISPYKQKGIDKFRNYEFDEAIINFQKALEYNYEDPATHFNLACCFSILEELDDSFFHLEKAVEFGFNDIKKIHSHQALSFLRTQPEFERFVENGYRRLIQLNPSQQTQATSAPVEEEGKEAIKSDLLEQIMQLGELREKGILTEEEFSQQKRKILGK